MPATHNTLALNDQEAGQQFETILNERLAQVTTPPNAQPKNFKTLGLKILIALAILGVGGLSASFSIGPSKDESKHLNEETGVDDYRFYMTMMLWLSFCSLFTNAFQASGIMFDALLTLMGICERSPEEKALLEQPTFWSILSHNKHSVATLILAMFAALSMGELAAENEPDDRKLIWLLLIWVLNIPLSERGLRDAVEAIPLTPANVWDRIKVKRKTLAKEEAATNIAARKAKRLLSKRLKTSFDDFLQIKNSEDRQHIIAVFANSELSTANKFRMLLNLSKITTDIESNGTTVGPRPATHKFNPYRLWCLVVPVTTLMILAQNGYVFASENGIDSLIDIPVLGSIWLALATAVYGGLTLESTVALTSNVFNGEKTLHQVLQPKIYKATLITSIILGSCSGAPLANTNWQTTGGTANQTVVHLPRNIRFANEALGGMSDPMANIYFFLLCLQDLAIESVKYFDSTPSNRELIYLHELIQRFSSDFNAMPIRNFIGVLNSYDKEVMSFNDIVSRNRLLDINDLIVFFRENGMTENEMLLLFPTLTRIEKENYLHTIVESNEPTESAPLLPSSRNTNGRGSSTTTAPPLDFYSNLGVGSTDRKSTPRSKGVSGKSTDHSGSASEGQELMDFSSDHGTEPKDDIKGRCKRKKRTKQKTAAPPVNPDLEPSYMANAFGDGAAADTGTTAPPSSRRSSTQHSGTGSPKPVSTVKPATTAAEYEKAFRKLDEETEVEANEAAAAASQPASARSSADLFSEQPEEQDEDERKSWHLVWN